MGKRRIRCLKRLGFDDILAFDISSERRKEAREKYGVTLLNNLEDIDSYEIDAVIISTPPDKHDEFIERAIKMETPAFVEASVVLGKLERLEKDAKKNKVLIIPSCTLKYHPAISKIIEIVKKGSYGRVTNFTYHSGQYLPDWHPYEDIKNFYVSKKETGATREIVAFEMSWLTELAGFPGRITGFKGKTMKLGVEIDDTYAIAMELEEGGYGLLHVDVVSRYATRSFILNLEYAQILWRWDENAVKVYDARAKHWINYFYTLGKAAKGYNKNIGEDMYVNELKAFIQAVLKKANFPNTLGRDIAILKLLNSIEKF